MENTEIERKFLIPRLPDDLESYPSTHIWQGYLCARPTVRIRKEDQTYTLTYKGRGHMAREEYNLPLSLRSFLHLSEKIDGIPIVKTRYRIPLEPYTIELDVFEGPHEGIWMAEVEFPTLEEAAAFTPPAWFGPEVTHDHRYHNVWLAGL